MKVLQKKRTVKYTLNDIPLEQESGRRHLPVVMCLLVFLFILVLAAATSLNGALNKWQHLNGQKKITIEIIQDEKKPVDLNKITQLLPKIKGIASFEIISNDKVLLLLKPWLSDTNNIKDLKLPILIDVNLDQKDTFNTAEAERLLKEITPSVRLESHAKWQQNITTLTSSVRIISYSVMGFILLAILIIVSVTTRASLNIHKSTIDTLRLMGARNRYISSYFQNSSFYLCLKGGILGLLLALPTIAFFSWLSQRFGMPKLFTFESQPWSWLVIISAPFVISFLAMLISQLAVIRTLTRMDA